jgi:Leucine-rich repeat (LRR) protein
MDFLTALLSNSHSTDHLAISRKPLRAFTEEQARALSDFTYLKDFSLTRAGLTATDLFPLLPRLQTLNLSHNQLRGGFEALVRLPELVSLNLNSNKIDDLEALKVFGRSEKLEVLWVLSNPVMEIPQEVLKCELFITIANLQNLNGFDKAGDSLAESDADSCYSPREHTRLPKRMRSRSPRI